MKRAVLIGLNYASIPEIQLNGCINDIENMRNVLIAQYGYASENVVMMRDDDPAAMQPTRENIIAQLQRVVAASVVGDEVWIHYSGHGSQVRNITGGESDGLDEVIVPIDYATAGLIKDDLLREIIGQVPCTAMLIFDSCHSGTICDLEWNFDYISGTLFRRSQTKSRPIKNKNIFVLSGCKDPQTSSDAYSSSKREYIGAFSDAMMDVLAANKYSIKIPNLIRQIYGLLAARGFSQKPGFSSSCVTPAYSFTPVQQMSAAIKRDFRIFSTSVVNRSAPSTVFRKMKLVLS